MNKKKMEIIHAAQKLFIVHGYSNTSITDIISLANVSKGTFYNHFSSKTSCLVAILEEARKQTIDERHKVALNKKSNDMNVLIDQISQILWISHQNNHMELFITNFSEANKEIIDVLEKHTLLEVNWLANRLVDIYGEKIRDISYECSTQVFGMILMSMRVLMIANKQQFIPPEDVVRMVISHTDAIIHRLQETGEVIITSDIFRGLQDDHQKGTSSKATIIQQLQKLIDKLSKKDSPIDGIELAEFLLEELQKPEEKLYVLQSILDSFTKAFENTPHQKEVNEISTLAWEYLETRGDKGRQGDGSLVTFTSRHETPLKKQLPSSNQ